MVTETETFSWVDYLVLAILLAMTGVIGLVLFFINRNSSSEHAFTGGKKMTLLPITMTLFAAFISASGMLGVPAEVNLYGSSICFELLGYLLAGIVTGVLFIPFYYNLGYTSLYLYAEDRFNSRIISIMMSVAYIIQMFLYMAVVLYGPSSAVATVTGMELELCIIIVGAICTFYTAAGGIVAVMWNDVYQSALMIAGLVTMLVAGFIAVGFENVFDISYTGHRLDDLIHPIVAPDLFRRHTVWSVLLGGFCLQLSLFSGSQAAFQRYSSCVTLTTARLGLLLGFICFLLFWAGLYLMGYITYAYFTCDPLLSGGITETAQIVPKFLMSVLPQDGAAGFVTAGILGASLTTLAAGVNAVSTVTILNIIVPIREMLGQPKFSDRVIKYLTYGLTGVCGLITIGLAFVTRVLGSLIGQIIISIFGVVGAPLLGVVICAVFIPRVNWIGAAIGLWTSMALGFWIDIGAIIEAYNYPGLPPRTETCPQLTPLPNDPNDKYAVYTTSAPFDDFFDIYRLSYQLYGPIALVICLTLAILFSFITDWNYKRKPPAHLTYWGVGRGTQAATTTEDAAADVKDEDKKVGSNISLKELRDSAELEARNEAGSSKADDSDHSDHEESSKQAAEVHRSSQHDASYSNPGYEADEGKRNRSRSGSSSTDSAADSDAHNSDSEKPGSSKNITEVDI